MNSVYSSMNIWTIGQASMLAVSGTVDGLFSLATNHIIPNTSSTQTSSSTKTPQNATYTLYEAMSSGYALDSRGLLIAGNSDAVVNVKPQFFPVATQGSECAALVTTLDWADKNLASYEWINVGTSSTAAYFVTGVLNSSQTEKNDPFDQGTQVTVATCWAGGFLPGLNPFA